MRITTISQSLVTEETVCHRFIIKELYKMERQGTGTVYKLANKIKKNTKSLKEGILQ